MNSRRKPSKVELLFNEYVEGRTKYYDTKLSRGTPIKDIIEESEKKKDFSIVKHLITNKFPQHKEYLFKYLLLK